MDQNRGVKDTSPRCIDMHTYCHQVAVFAEPLLTTGGALEHNIICNVRSSLCYIEEKCL